MNKKPNLVRRVIAEMVGKVGDNPNSFWTRLISRSLRPAVSSTNYERNNYDLFRSIYFNSVVNGLGTEYQIAAALGKPIVNITAGFVIGRGVRIELANPDGSTSIQAAETAINDWLVEVESDLFDLVKWGYRDGDSYVHIDEFGRLSSLDAKGVSVILDPVSNTLMGYDVEQEVEISDPNQVGRATQSSTWIYVKQYRLDSTRILRYPKAQPDNQEILWEKVFTVNGAIDVPTDEQGQKLGVPQSDIKERRLAVKGFHNEPEAQAVYGNSDYQNILNLFCNYSSVISEATRGVKYNAVPIPVLRGVKDPSKVESDPALGNETGTDQKKGVEWGQDKVIYLDGEKADAKMLTSGSFMSDVSALLNLYFYLFVQGTETPEFSLGTAVASSKASTETQMPILTKKVERKQKELKRFIKDLVETYIERRILMSDPMFLPLIDNQTQVRVSFPPIDDEDKQLTLDTVEWAYENELLSAQTVLELILGDKVKNVSEELKAAAGEAKKKAEASSANSDRLVSNLLKQSTSKTQTPAKPASTTPATGA